MPAIDWLPISGGCDRKYMLIRAIPPINAYRENKPSNSAAPIRISAQTFTTSTNASKDSFSAMASNRPANHPSELIR